MNRNTIAKEIQKRLVAITTGNGYSYSVTAVLRNPEEEPSPDLMPIITMFELTDRIDEERRLGASRMPAYKRSFQVALELWRKSTTSGLVSQDVLTMLSDVRKVIFADGTTLGGIASHVVELETSRIFRPPIGNYVGGIGILLEIKYTEDFSLL